MAVHLATNADYLQRTTALLPTAGSRTWMAWVRQVVVPVGPANYNTPMASLNNTPATYTQFGGVFLNTDGNDLALSVPAGTDDDFGPPQTANTWSHFAWTTSGTTQTLFVNGTSVATFALDLSGLTTVTDVLGGDSLSGGNIDLAYCRQWTAALTQAQIRIEMASTVAVLTTGLYMDCPLVSDLLDDSGAGHDWTQIGSGSFVAGPSLVPNAAATTATVITLPFSVTQKITPSTSLNPHVWFTYTAVAGDVVIGTWAFTSLASPNKPSVKIWYGTATALNELDDIVDIGDTVTNVPYSVPITPSTQYFFEVINAGLDVAATADMTFSAVAQPTQTITRGDVMVNDETFGFPVVALQSSSGAVKRHKVFSAGESADIQPDGLVLADAVDFNLDPVGLQIWDADFTLVNTIAYPVSFHDEVRHIYTSPLGGWFVAAKGADTTHSTVVKVNMDGSFGPTTWTISHPATTQFNLGMAVNSDESILYYAVTGAANVSVQRWDLVNDVALADLVAGVANYNVMQDILVLSDDTIVVAYKKITAVRDSYVLQYSTAGAVLNTFHVGSSTMAVNRMCRALDDPASFWVWIYPQDAGGHIDGTNRYLNVVIADGSFASDFTVAQYERGVYAAAASATPTARFGPSFSCPMWIHTSVGVTPSTPQNYLIRRERIFPHLSQEQFWQFFSMLQLDLETGVGLSEGQGSDPQVMLQWSDDGGHTWSNEHWVSAGRQGQYTARAIWRMLGRSRDRVWKIAMSDPVKWAVLSAYTQVQKGTS